MDVTEWLAWFLDAFHRAVYQATTSLTTTAKRSNGTGLSIRRAYTMSEIGAHFGIYYMTGSRAVPRTFCRQQIERGNDNERQGKNAARE
jgi:hypothetical protein